MNQKLIGSLRLKRLCFVIQRLTLRRIDSLKLRRWYLHFLIPIRSMNQKLIGSLRLRRSYFVIQRLMLRRIDLLKLKHLPTLKLKLRLTGSLRLKRLCFAIQRLTLRLIDSLKLRRWYLLTHLVMWIHLTKLTHLMLQMYSMMSKQTLRVTHL